MSTAEPARRIASITRTTRESSVEVTLDLDGTGRCDISTSVPFYDHMLVDEGKAHLSIAFGCTGGQHRSVAMAEGLAMALAEDGRQVSIRHRELERRKTDERPM